MVDYIFDLTEFTLKLEHTGLVSLTPCVRLAATATAREKQLGRLTCIAAYRQLRK